MQVPKCGLGHAAGPASSRGQNREILWEECNCNLVRKAHAQLNSPRIVGDLSGEVVMNHRFADHVSGRICADLSCQSPV